MSLDIRPNPSATGSVTGGLEYKGSYNATANTPDLTSSEKGDFYIVSVAGTLATISLDVGDHIVFNQDASSPITSAMFDKIDNTDAVSSVNGETGVVVLDTDDVSEGSSNLYYTNARFDTQLGTKDTDDLSEGATNLYYTNARADARIGAANLTDLNDVNYTAGSSIDGYVLEYVHANNRWEAKAASGGGFSYTAITSASSPVTAAVSTHYGADSSGGAITFNLPALSGLTGGEEIRIKLNTAGNNLTLTANGADTIEGSGSTYVMSIAKESVTCVASSGTNWEII
jgi:hypothetical protein